MNNAGNYMVTEKQELQTDKTNLKCLIGYCMNGYHSLENIAYHKKIK